MADDGTAGGREELVLHEPGEEAPAGGRRRWVVRGAFAVLAAVAVVLAGLAVGQVLGPVVASGGPAGETLWSDVDPATREAVEERVDEAEDVADDQADED